MERPGGTCRTAPDKSLPVRFVEIFAACPRLTSKPHLQFPGAFRLTKDGPLPQSLKPVDPSQPIFAPHTPNVKWQVSGRRCIRYRVDQRHSKHRFRPPSDVKLRILTAPPFRQACAHLTWTAREFGGSLLGAARRLPDASNSLRRKSELSTGA